jgi:hypothetical protein
MGRAGGSGPRRHRAVIAHAITPRDRGKPHRCLVRQAGVACPFLGAGAIAARAACVTVTRKGVARMDKQSVIDVDLFCLQCNQETAHRVEYLDGRIHRIQCEECGRMVEVWHEHFGTMDRQDVGHQRVHWSSLTTLYAPEFLNRVLSKPKRMEKELQADLSLFLITLPLRLVTKPMRILQEILRHDHEEP